jgi:Helix-turn-helix domain
MTRMEVIGMMTRGVLTVFQAADILGLCPRQLRRLRRRYELFGDVGLMDGRFGLSRKKRVPEATIEELCRLKREVYPDFSLRHFHERAVEKHGLKVSYTFTRDLLQLRGVVSKAAGRGKYRRKRERRPLVGMMLHLDASTHEWIPELPMQDLVVMLDDADGRILYACFVEQEGTRSTLEAIAHVLRRHGRFCELYTDRGSHFCRTEKAGQGPAPEQAGQVSRVLRALGIRQILARSPEARGRSERCFGTIQGRLPQELRLHGIRSYPEANRYLDDTFVPDFNRRFTVQPPQPGNAFTRLAGIDVTLLVSVQHDRVVANDNTVVFGKLTLQLPRLRDRLHLARCPVLVHELLDDSLGVSFSGKLIARFNRQGAALPTLSNRAA